MDLPAPIDPQTDDATGAEHAVLAEVTCSWASGAERTTAVMVHAARGMLVLEAADARQTLPPPGTVVTVAGHSDHFTGRVAEHGRGGRFLISVGGRPVRRSLRLRVSLPGTLRSAEQPDPTPVEIVDLTTGGARVRGVQLPVGSHVTLDFTPPGRDQSVTVRALVAHGTHRAEQPWIGVSFRLVALRGGR